MRVDALKRHDVHGVSILLRFSNTTLLVDAPRSKTQIPSPPSDGLAVASSKPQANLNNQKRKKKRLSTIRHSTM